jgi:RNA polymerase-binding protein DksA
MDRQGQERLRQRLLRKKHDLTARLERIRSNVQRGLDRDSAERAKQLEDSDVVDALGKEARLELLQIAATLRRMDDGQFGVCIDCGSPIEDARLEAYPYATECIDCARRGEIRRSAS